MTTLVRAPGCSSTYSQHPVFKHNLQHGADVVARYLATKPIVAESQVQARAHAAHLANVSIRGLTIAGAEASPTELPVHNALEAFGELALEQHALAQYDEGERRDVIALVAAMHLALYGPLPAGNWGGFTTPEIAGCPICVRNNIIRWVRMPSIVARATADGILDPAWMDDATMLDEQRTRYVRLTWRVSTLSIRDHFVAKLAPLGFAVSTHEDLRLIVASRVLTGALAKAMRWGENQFRDVGALWYGAEMFFTMPPTY